MHKKDYEPARIVQPADRNEPRTNADHHAQRFRPTLSGDSGRTLRRGDARMALGLSPTECAHINTGPVSGGGRGSSWAGRAHGGIIGSLSGTHTAAGLGFDQAIGPRGYRWWYIDAMSDDGHYGLAVIGLVGSVFSPYYARARAKGDAHPEQHCAMNVVLYGPGGKRWAMTERGAGDLRRSGDELAIGPSSISGDASGLTIKIDEVTVPWLSRLRGEIQISFDAIQPQHLSLDDAGHHYWWPIAPMARATVTMKQPELRWQGHAYVDANGGSIPLEDTFERWDWSRAQLTDGSTVVLYTPQQIEGDAPVIAMRFRPNAEPHSLQDMQGAALPVTPIWRVCRGTLTDSGQQPLIQKTLEDTPFYARSVLQTRLLGERALAMHESLSLSRFRRPWVQLLLPFRMPRRAPRQRVAGTNDGVG